MEELHKGHPGILPIKALAGSNIWWPGMDHQIERWARACSPCTQVKSDPALVALDPWVWPTKPWRRIHIDFAGPLLNKTYLVIVGAFSKWPQRYARWGVTSTTKIIDVLQHLFCKYGIPEQVVSDNGPQFRSEEF
uniref:Integrase catalytic domain-containing protein n=1 Tax=Amphimedon queenslandica TaxID=400682 RepID=A0A1X7V4Q1_AMPQE